MAIRVCERTVTLCGETHLAGIPCALVRCGGCSLRCRWCDTPEAQEPQGELLSVGELEAWVRSTRLRLVLLTGGEPLEQPEIPELARRHAAQHEVLVETNGAEDIRPLAAPVIRSLDIKCPGSGESDRNRWDNLEVLRPGDAVKLVLTGRQDYEYAKEVVARYRLEPPVQVLLSPVGPELAPLELARWMLEDRWAGARLNVQVHRWLWPELENPPK